MAHNAYTSENCQEGGTSGSVQEPPLQPNAPRLGIGPRSCTQTGIR